MEFRDYNRITDTVIQLGPRAALKVNVVLSNLGINKDRSFHSEVETVSGIKINRKFDYFLTIEKSCDDYYASVMIRPQDMILLQERLNQIEHEWFRDSKAFAIKNKSLIVLKTQPIVVPGLAADKYLQFDPIIFQFDESSPTSMGIRITLGDPNRFVDIDTDRFYALLYSISTLPLFQVAQNMVNYLGRPEFGTNLFIMEEYTVKHEKLPKARTVSSNKRKKTDSTSAFGKLGG